MHTIATRLDVGLWRSARRAPSTPDTQLIETPTANVRLRDSHPGSQQAALIFLCDPPMLVDHYDAVIDALAPLRLIVVELPGFGFSAARHHRALGFDGAVDAVEAALATLKLPACVPVGPCIGGFVAAAMAQRQHLPVRGLVLVQTPDVDGMRAWSERMDPKHRLRAPVFGQLMMRAMARKLTAFWCRYASARHSDHVTLNAIAQAGLKAGAAYSLASMLQRWGDGLRDSGLDLPTLVVWGEQDRSHTHTDRMCSHAHASGAAIHCITDSGHFPDLETPEQFAALVRPFAEPLLTPARD